MRVIAGTYRSRPLTAPRGQATRPTSDRLRETLFNVLAARIEGAFFADLYAGSGAVGIEALSRGASRVCFVDNSPSAVAAIRANLASLKIQSGFSIDTRGVSAVLDDFSQCRAQTPWDLIFLDPPYRAARAYESTLQTLGRLADITLAPGGIVIVEHQAQHRAQHGAQHGAEASLAESYGILHRYRVLKQSEAALSFYQVTA
jgi:16S rRNA (guanine966-N2)-methyltransferase